MEFSAIVHEALVARPALDPQQFERYDPLRWHEIWLYPTTNTTTTFEKEKKESLFHGHAEGKEKENCWKYRLSVVDHPFLLSPSNNNNVKEKKPLLRRPTTVFLVPAGRETEPLFYTARGLAQICEWAAHSGRLIAVALGRPYSNGVIPATSMTMIETELLPFVEIIHQQGRFLPKSFQRHGILNQAITFVLMPEGLGYRKVLDFAETFCVEQVRMPREEWVRRLYYLNKNSNTSKNNTIAPVSFAIQAQVFVQKTGDEAECCWKVDPGRSLALEYQRILAAGLLALCQLQQEPVKGLVLGLGGGGTLVSYLQYLLGCDGRLDLVIVERDHDMVNVACQYFGVVIQRQGCRPRDQEQLEGKRDGAHVWIQDGLSIQVEEDEGKERKDNKDDEIDSLLTFPAGHFSFIVMDLDYSPDPAQNSSSNKPKTSCGCPPIAYLQLDYLKRLGRLLEASGRGEYDKEKARSQQPGILAMHVDASDPGLFRLLCDNVQKTFRCMVIADPNLVIGSNRNSNRIESSNEKVVIFASDFEITKLGIPQIQQRLRQALATALQTRSTESLPGSKADSTTPCQSQHHLNDLEQTLLDSISRRPDSFLSRPDSSNNLSADLDYVIQALAPPPVNDANKSTDQVTMAGALNVVASSNNDKKQKHRGGGGKKKGKKR